MLYRTQCKERLKILEAVLTQRKQSTLDRIFFVHRRSYIEVCVYNKKLKNHIKFSLTVVNDVTFK